MSDDANNLTCAAFQAQLSDLIASGEDVNSHPHLRSCGLCRALLADLETIAEAARQLFPIVERACSRRLFSHPPAALRKLAALAT
ncbi:MAG: hypothetical protein ABR987_12980 [Terracidiphilus sp.]